VFIRKVPLMANTFTRSDYSRHILWGKSPKILNFPQNFFTKSDSLFCKPAHVLHTEITID